MPSLHLDHHKLFFADRRPPSKTPTMLLIHGAAGSHAIWPQTFFNIPDIRVMALDLPGHGRSTPPGRRTIEQYAAATEEFIAALGLENVTLVGHSMGSAIALTIALRGAADVRNLALLGASARMPVHESVLRNAINAPDELAAFVAANGLGQATAELQGIIQREAQATDATTVFGDFLACNRFDLRPRLSAIDIPTLVIAGALDRMTPLRFSESLAAGLPQAQLITLEGTGHFAMLERPDDVKSLIADFINDKASTELKAR